MRRERRALTSWEWAEFIGFWISVLFVLWATGMLH